MRAAAAVMLLSCAACGPVSVAQAERNCAGTQGTAGLSGLARMGYASPGGLRSSLEIDLNTQSDTGRDLSAEYAACVYRQSGELPRRPLSAL